MSKNIIPLIIVVYLTFDIRNVRLDNTSSQSISKNDPANKITDTKALIDSTHDVPAPNKPLNETNPPVADKSPTPKIVNSTTNATVETKIEKKINTLVDQSPPSLELTSDAFLRGFYVFIGLGVVVMIYLGVRTFKVKPITPDTMVRKYGVTAKRGDLEMLPLPLAEEDDDDTLFDVGNHLRPNIS